MARLRIDSKQPYLNGNWMDFCQRSTYCLVLSMYILSRKCPVMINSAVHMEGVLKYCQSRKLCSEYRTSLCVDCVRLLVSDNRCW